MEPYLRNDFNPLVSIVIPVYNGSDYMREAIESALAQTYDNLEVIVVNDGSTDHGMTERIAKSYGPKIRYFSKVNGGVASALNYGISEMKGEYFSWLSHDDMYYEKKIDAQINHLRQVGKDAIIYGDFDIVDKKSRLLRHVEVSAVPPNRIRYALLSGLSINGCTVLVPRLCFSKAGIFNEELRTTQDFEMWFRLSQSFEFQHLRHTGVKSRVHPNQGIFQIAGHKDEVEEIMIRCISQISPEDLLVMSEKSSIREAYTDIATFWEKRAYQRFAAYARSMSDDSAEKYHRAPDLTSQMSNRDLNGLHLPSRRGTHFIRMSNLNLSLGKDYLTHVDVMRLDALMHFGKAVLWNPFNFRVYINIFLTCMPKGVIRAWQEYRNNKVDR